MEIDLLLIFASLFIYSLIYLLFTFSIFRFTKYVAPIVLSIIANWNLIFIKNGPEIQVPGVVPAVIISAVGKPPMKVRISNFQFIVNILIYNAFEYLL